MEGDRYILKPQRGERVLREFDGEALGLEYEVPLHVQLQGHLQGEWTDKEMVS